MRILVLLAIALLLYVIINNLIKKTKPSIEKDNTEKMVKCDVCGLHVVEREAVKEGNQYFCCRDHLEFSRKK